jgi:hypothetical protein
MPFAGAFHDDKTDAYAAVIDANSSSYELRGRSLSAAHSPLYPHISSSLYITPPVLPYLPITLYTSLVLKYDSHVIHPTAPEPTTPIAVASCSSDILAGDPNTLSGTLDIPRES